MNEDMRISMLEALDNLKANDKKIITAALDLVRNDGISNYPILIAFDKHITYELGLPLGLFHESLEFNISTLEELFVKNIVNQEKVNNFRAVFNHKSEHICVLIISDDLADFVFYPV
jgi:hypothetical protein